MMLAMIDGRQFVRCRWSTVGSLEIGALRFSLSTRWRNEGQAAAAKGVRGSLSWRY